MIPYAIKVKLLLIANGMLNITIPKGRTVKIARRDGTKPSASDIKSCIHVQNLGHGGVMRSVSLDSCFYGLATYSTCDFPLGAVSLGACVSFAGWVHPQIPVGAPCRESDPVIHRLVP